MVADQEDRARTLDGVDTGRLPREQRIALAQLQGAAPRLARCGHGDRFEPADPVEALREISADPVLLGLAAGVLTCDWWNADAVRLLQEAGADMAVAAEHAADVQARLDRRGPGPTL